MESHLNKLIQVLNNVSKKDNDFTIKDWDSMTDSQKEPYLKTELNFLKTAIKIHE